MKRQWTEYEVGVEIKCVPNSVVLMDSSNVSSCINEENEEKSKHMSVIQFKMQKF